MWIKFLFLLLLTISFTGCAGNKLWIRDSTSAEQANKDFNECKYDSSKSSFVPFGNGISGMSAGFQEGMQSANLMSQCMSSRGYYLVNKFEHEQRNKKIDDLANELKLAIDKKDNDKAFEIINKIIEERPKDSGVYVWRGSIYSSIKKYNEAISDYNKAISLGNENAFVVVAKAEAFICLKEYDIAISLIDQSLTSKKDASLYNIRAYALNEKGEYDKALEDCNKSIALDSSRPNAYKNRGLSYLGKGQYEMAIEQFNMAIGIEPKYGYAYSGRAEAFLKLSKNESAESDFKKACEYGDNESCSKIK